jgi:hypothetical protein
VLVVAVSKKEKIRIETSDGPVEIFVAKSKYGLKYYINAPKQVNLLRVPRSQIPKEEEE